MDNIFVNMLHAILRPITIPIPFLPNIVEGKDIFINHFIRDRLSLIKKVMILKNSCYREEQYLK